MRREVTIVNKCISAFRIAVAVAIEIVHIDDKVNERGGHQLAYPRASSCTPKRLVLPGTLAMSDTQLTS